MNSLPKEEARRIIKRHQEKSSAIWLWVLLTIILIVLGWFGLMKSTEWINTHTIEKQRILSMVWKWPLDIKSKEEPQVIEKPLILEYPEEIDTPLEKYICEKWGPFECKTALAVSLAENGTRQRDRFNINTNNTIDVGIFQINSIHFTKDGCALYQIVDPIQNVDCAYKIWQSSGWSAWVAHNNGNYLAKLDE